MSGAEDVAGIKKMLSPDWFNVLKNNIKGTQSLIMAKEEVEMQTKNMFFENKALQQLIDSGRGDGAEANFLRKHMAKVTYSLITKYKDVVDTKFATAVGQAALNVKDEYEE